MKTLVFLMISSLLLFNCKKNDASLSSSSSDGVHISLSGELKLGQDITVKVEPAHQVRKCHWQISDVDGTPLTGICSSYESCTMSCNFQTPGVKNISLDATLNDNSVQHLTYSTDLLDQGTVDDNQAPIIRMDMRTSASGPVQTTVATFAQDAKGKTFFLEDKDIYFDLTRTTDDNDDRGELDYKVTFSFPDSFSTEKDTPTFKLNFPDPVVASVLIEVTDSDGKKAEKQFQLYIHCESNDFTLSTNPTVTQAAGGPNYFAFNAGNSPSKANSNYMYRWDLNGDGMFDTPWSDQATATDYIVYNGPRNLTLEVKDQCQLPEVLSFDNTFVIPQADGLMSEDEPFPLAFLQGTLAGTSNGNDSANANADFIAIQDPADPAPRPHVECNYQRSSNGGTATLMVEALHNFQTEGENRLANKYKMDYGMHLDIGGIQDDYTVVGLDPAAAKITTAYYITDEDSDSIAGDNYSKDGNCSFTLQTTPMENTGICGKSDAPAATGIPQGIIFHGIYSCPKLTSNLGKTISITNGEFYCVVNDIKPCPPGGGGGGGSPTISQ